MYHNVGSVFYCIVLYCKAFSSIQASVPSHGVVPLPHSSFTLISYSKSLTARTVLKMPSSMLDCASARVLGSFTPWSQHLSRNSCKSETLWQLQTCKSCKLQLSFSVRYSGSSTLFASRFSSLSPSSRINDSRVAAYASFDEYKCDVQSTTPTCDNKSIITTSSPFLSLLCDCYITNLRITPVWLTYRY